MTKREAIERKARWQQALSEGRVVKDGMTLTSYPTVERALEAVARSGGEAWIKIVSPEEI